MIQLQTQVDQLTKLNGDHRRRASLSRRQAQQLIEDKAELQALLHDRDHEISRVRDRLKRYSRDAASDALAAEVSDVFQHSTLINYCCIHNVFPSVVVVAVVVVIVVVAAAAAAPVCPVRCECL